MTRRLTKQQREAWGAVARWLAARGVEFKSISHIHPRAYVIGRTAPRCLVVARCWADSEPLCRDMTRENPLMSTNEFDDSLNAGDWCITAYVVEAGGCQRDYAVPLEEQA